MNNMPKNNKDVISLPVELDEKIVDGKFRLVIAVIKRAKELHKGAMPKIATKARKITTAALEEVISGSVPVLTGKAALKAQEEADKLVHENVVDEASLKVSFPEQLTELEKDLEAYLLTKRKTDG